MSWQVVAKKDFRDAARSRLLWGLTALFVVFIAGFAYLYTVLQGLAPNGASLDTLGLIHFLSGPVTLLVPIIGLVVGHKSIAGEVESGSAKLLLSLPHSRRDAVVGKVVGRTGVLSLSIVVGWVVGIVVTLAFYDTVNFAAMVVFGVLAVLLGAVYIAIGVGISSLTNSGSRAVVGAVSFYIIMEVVWGFVPNAMNYLVNGQFLLGRNNARWYRVLYHFINRLAPSNAYNAALNAFVPDATVNAATGGVPGSVVLSGPAMLVVLVAWLVLAPLVGYLRFEARDL